MKREGRIERRGEGRKGERGKGGGERQRGIAMEKVTEKEGVVGRGAGKDVGGESALGEDVLVEGLGEGVRSRSHGRRCGGRRCGRSHGHGVVVEGLGEGEGVGEGLMGEARARSKAWWAKVWARVWWAKAWVRAKVWWETPRRGQSRKQMDKNQCVRTEQATTEPRQDRTKAFG